MGNRAVYRQDVELRVGKIEQLFATNQLPDNRIAYTIRLVVNNETIHEHWLDTKDLRQAFDLANVLQSEAVAMDTIIFKTEDLDNLKEEIMIDLFKRLMDKIKRMSKPDWTIEKELEVQ